MSGHVEIHYGTITAATITDEKGTRPLLTHLGSQRFFVSVIETNGTRISMWDGKTYDEAIIEAAILSKDFGPVHDLVLGGSA